MAKQREGRETEYYKGIIRHLKAQNKRLKRQIRELEKETLYITEEDAEVLTDPGWRPSYDCTKCNQGNLEKFEINGRSFLICNNCKDRKKTT
jgi:hypothetical protein